MTEASIAFSNSEQILLLFGAQDRNLRRVRDAVGIDVTIRGDEIRLRGTEEQIKRGLAVFAELRAIIEKRGELAESEVQGVLCGSTGKIFRPDTSRTNRLPQETQGTSRNGLGSRAGNSTNGGTGADKAPTYNNRLPREPQGIAEGVEASINLFERARRVSPRTLGQSAYISAIRENDLVFCTGPAGSGKTYLAVAMALNALRQEQVKKIVLVRPAVEAGEKLGFLPGDLVAKVNPFLRPLLDALCDMIDYEQVKRYMENDVIEIIPLGYMRGRTLNQAFIILDEGQNTTITQMKMFLTRLGQGSKIVVTGDTTQTDLPSHVTSGLNDAIRRLARVEGVGNVLLKGEDIVRHRLVREIVKAYDDQRVYDRPDHGRSHDLHAESPGDRHPHEEHHDPAESHPFRSRKKR